MEYNLYTVLVSILTAISIGMLYNLLIKKVPALQETRTVNIVLYKYRTEDKNYDKQLKKNAIGAAGGYLISFLCLMPFVISQDVQPIWVTLIALPTLVMVFDLFYYPYHRFVLHGKLSKHHEVHHKHKHVCKSDGSYQDPLDTFLGLSLFGISTTIVAVFIPIDFICLSIWTLFFFKIGQHNHAVYDVNTFPFNIFNNQVKSHRLHHEDNTSGNYGYITMFYDWLFGTYNK